MSVLGADDTDSHTDGVPDVAAIADNNRDLLERIAQRDDRWGEGARRMLREADDE